MVLIFVIHSISILTKMPNPSLTHKNTHTYTNKYTHKHIHTYTYTKLPTLLTKTPLA